MPDVDTTSSTPDLSEFSDLYERCLPAVWAYAVSRVGRQAAEDVVSDMGDRAPEREAAWWTLHATDKTHRTMR